MSRISECRRIGSIPKTTAITVLRAKGEERATRPLGLRPGGLSFGSARRNAIQRQPTYEEGETNWAKAVQEQVYKRPERPVSKIIVPEKTQPRIKTMEVIDDYNGRGDLGLILEPEGMSLDGMPFKVQRNPDHILYYSTVSLRGGQAAYLVLATYGDVFVSRVAPIKDGDGRSPFPQEWFVPELSTYIPQSMRVANYNELIVVRYSRLPVVNK